MRGEKGFNIKGYKGKKKGIFRLNEGDGLKSGGSILPFEFKQNFRQGG
jgi:hypothetical protein